MPVALVTGASRGVGRGAAIGLAAAGFTVFATGRSIDSSDLPPSVVRIQCDHCVDTDTARVFERIAELGEGLDILVNSAWGGYERMVENGQFTWGLPFWQQPAHRWSSMMDAGVRAAFFASAQAAPMMVAAAPRIDREYQLLGGAKIRGQFDLRNRKGSHGQDVVGHGARASPERRGRRVALSGVGANRSP